jgi:hypothetical protein
MASDIVRSTETTPVVRAEAIITLEPTWLISDGKEFIHSRSPAIFPKPPTFCTQTSAPSRVAVPLLSTAAHSCSHATFGRVDCGGRCW